MTDISGTRRGWFLLTGVRVAGLVVGPVVGEEV